MPIFGAEVPLPWERVTKIPESDPYQMKRYVLEINHPLSLLENGLYFGQSWLPGPMFESLKQSQAASGLAAMCCPFNTSQAPGIE